MNKEFNVMMKLIQDLNMFKFTILKLALTDLVNLKIEEGQWYCSLTQKGVNYVESLPEEEREAIFKQLDLESDNQDHYIT